MISIGRNFIKELPEGFVVTDTNVFAAYSYLFKNRDLFITEAGEQSKNGETYLAISNEINYDTIVAVGGGVVGDLAGFVAATFRRGIKLIHVPTTLLAMCDSSIGGKNGINLGMRKNYLGTIYDPTDILFDLAFLETLPEKEFKNGVAEIVKYGFVFNDPLLKSSIRHQDMEEVIRICYDLKMKAIKGGFRDVLNFGHTIGHAVELLFKLDHGRAITVGMVKEAKIGEKIGILEEGFTNELQSCLMIENEIGFGLHDFTCRIDEMMEVMKLDKKNKDGKIVFSFNESHPNVELSVEEVIQHLQSND